MLASKRSRPPLWPTLALSLAPFLGCGQVVGWPIPCSDCTSDTSADDTSGTSDTTAPHVLSTLPADAATDVATGDGIVVTFDEVMDPLSLTTSSFTVLQGTESLAGIVTQFGATAVFFPDADLAIGTAFTATVGTQAADAAGNTLEADYAWSFTTGSGLDVSAPTVIVTNPVDLEADVSLSASVTATFSEPMDPGSVAAALTVADPDGALVFGTVTLDGSGFTSTFDPAEALLPSAVYTATISDSATDLAGNALADAYTWTFTTGETPPAQAAVSLGSLSTFVAVSGGGLTNSNSSGTTTLNGDVGLSPTATCLGDGSPCTLTNPVINGTLYANDAEGVAAQAKDDLTAAYVDAMGRPPGTTVNDITGMTLPPGVYTSGSTMSVAVGGQVILDGEGDANAVWIFQVGSSLTVNNDAQILLINGADAENVFWAVFASSTLGSNVSFQGSVLAGASNSAGTDSTVVGRLLCTTGIITLLSNTITLP